jgi:hypothetical protein
MIIKVLFYFSPKKENMNEKIFPRAVTNDMAFYMFLSKNSLLNKIRSSNAQNFNRWKKNRMSLITERILVY